MKILFLDVDGPLIPTRLHVNIGGLFKYDMRDGLHVWDPEVIQNLNDHCPSQDIKLVFNTMHNTGGISLIKDTALMNGISADLLHPDLITRFPLGIDDRLGGIYDWLNRNVPVNQSCKWVVVDDFQLPVHNLVNVDLHYGITDKDIIRIFSMFLHDEEISWSPTYA